MAGFKSFDNSTCEILDPLDRLEAGPSKVVVQRITVIEFGVNGGGGNGGGCFEIEVRTDTAELTNGRIYRKMRSGLKR